MEFKKNYLSNPSFYIHLKSKHKENKNLKPKRGRAKKVVFINKEKEKININPLTDFVENERKGKTNKEDIEKLLLKHLNK